MTDGGGPDGGSNDPTTSIFYPKALFDLKNALATAFNGKGDPATIPIAVIPNAVVPYWTACQIGTGRAASEVGSPVSFQGPASGKSSDQQAILSALIASGYKGLSVSVLDPTTPATLQVLQSATDKGIALVTIDSDAPMSSRLLYMGTDNYTAGLQAGQAMATALGAGGGKVVGLVGYKDAQNAIDRISGIKAGMMGSTTSLVEVFYDNTDSTLARSNVQDAMTKYPDLAGLIGIYSYNGPAAAGVVDAAGKAGAIKIVAFDLQSDTQAYLKSGVITAAIGQRPYMMGYLSVYVLRSVNGIGGPGTLSALQPWLTGTNHDVIDTGIDVITSSSLGGYISFLQSLGIGSQ